MTIGSRAEVFMAQQTKPPVVLRRRIWFWIRRMAKLRASRLSSRRWLLENLKSKAAMVRVFKPKKGKFSLQPKEGTKAYEKKIAKMEKLSK